jgi:hypothetical protein
MNKANKKQARFTATRTQAQRAALFLATLIDLCWTQLRFFDTRHRSIP